jgi:tannase/feruloyl esterase
MNYYEDVTRVFGARQTDQFVRLFMAPGMQHCRGGPSPPAGPDAFDELGALEQWVEQGRAPEKIIASHSTNGVVDRTRPLCPYPQVARYKGSGSTDEAANFECVRPAPSRGADEGPSLVCDVLLADVVPWWRRRGPSRGVRPVACSVRGLAVAALLYR